MITLSNERCVAAIFFDSLDLVVPGLSTLQLNLQPSYNQRQACFKGIVDTSAITGTTTSNFCR